MPTERDPVVDGRDRDALFTDAVGLAPGYTPSWDPNTEDAGAALVHLFSELAWHTTERLDQIPEKHRVAFAERLGFDRAPPQAARLPLTFAVAEGATENVAVPSGTRAVDDTKTVFETETGFETTPANLTNVITADPATDRLYSHSAAVAAGKSFRPFTGRDQQAHILTFGHADLLQQTPGASVRVRLRVGADSDTYPMSVTDYFADCLVWEWYGKATNPIQLDEPAPEDEPVEDWHVVEPTAVCTENDRWGEQVVEFDLEPPGTLTETNVADRTSRWLRATTNRNCDPEAVFRIAVGPVTLAVGDAVKRPPDALLATDVPLETPTTGAPILPFGDTPRFRDSFAIAAGDALTTPGATVTLSLTLVDKVSADGSPSVSWEYWNGDAWTNLPLQSNTDTAARQFTGCGKVVFEVPEDLAATAVAGEDGHWIRARLVGGNYGTVTYVRTVNSSTNTETWMTKADGVTPPKLSEIRLEYDCEERPDHLLASDNGGAPRDVSLALRERTQPFRRLPIDGQTLAFGFDRTLEDGPLQILWSPIDRATPADFAPRLAWTYSVASGSSAATNVTGEAGTSIEGDDADTTMAVSTDDWSELDVADGTEGLLTRGLLSVVLGNPTGEHAAFGASRHWLRATVIEDTFETPGPATGPTDLAVTIDRIDAPRETVRLRNDGPLPVDLSGYLLDVEYGNDEADQHRTFPAGTVIDASETLTVASGRLSPGPADVWFNFRTPVLNNTVPDEVALLTPGGRLVTSKSGWPDAEETADGVGSELDADGDADAGEADDCGCESGTPAALNPCDTTLPTTTSVGAPTETPPVVAVVAVNAGWATNVETITDEVLGGSGGTADQTFTVASPPVVGESVWIDETATLSATNREVLLAEQPDDVAVVGGVGDEESEPDAVWVRWTEVEDFVTSGPDDRHYTVDRLAGEVGFGDGRAGRIPPRGRDNVRISYETGGGTAGNVPPETVTKLESAIALVDAVSNPIAGDGGADAESTAAAVTRASRTLRDGDRAVTPVDFERVAATTTRKLARTRCLPATDAAGEHRAGFVTLVIVPASSARKPVPSASLRERVEKRVAAHAPTTVVVPSQLFVQGPSYVETTVETRVETTADAESIATVERAVDDVLSAFLHPLTGGKSGEGWAFGTLPCPADLFVVAEGVTSVDHVADLTVTFHGDRSDARVADGDDPPDVAADVLVYAGTHDVRASRMSAVEGSTTGNVTTGTSSGSAGGGE